MIDKVEIYLHDDFMQTEHVDILFKKYKKMVPAEQAVLLKSKLEIANDSVYDTIDLVKLRYPIVTVLLALFLGFVGADQFYLGRNGAGIRKMIIPAMLLIIRFVMGDMELGLIVMLAALAFMLIAPIVYFIWLLADVCKAAGRTKAKNLNLILSAL